MNAVDIDESRFFRASSFEITFNQVFRCVIAVDNFVEYLGHVIPPREDAIFSCFVISFTCG